MCPFKTIMKECMKEFSIGNKGQFCGICSSEEEIDYLFTRLKCVGYSYSVRSSAYNRLSSDATTSKPRFFFSQSQGAIQIPFFGSPFSVEYVSYRQCTLGPMYYDKNQIPIPNHLVDHIIPNKKRKLFMDTKKSDCPATFLVKCVRVYPGYLVLSQNDRKTKKMVIDSLKKHLELPNKPESFLRLYVVASPPEHHTHSAAHMKTSGDLHPRLALEIRNHVKNGTTSVREIKLLLEKFVETNFSGPARPDRVNTAFYPTDKTIYNHVYRTRKRIFGEDSLEIQTDKAYGCDSSSRCTAPINSVRNGVQNTSSSDERNKKHTSPEKSSPCSSLSQEARDICKNIIDLTYNCSDETIKKLVDDLRNVQRSVELPDHAGSDLPLTVATNFKIEKHI
ncbi:calcium-responsive transcription factor-like isoform X1 [Schistocerca serialis cubense]|uniref:calcium-responsive transcription factor-like isoform X1 n=2 Tax=Schistocerca serialis cubense TaxID=2023355 RepID=UPI00214EC671|nr:calcium-responsive transcription factor-like isoform X1 [Schistocerca serialis cubense]XP_049941035.1 calcium-responsive transcription factor-like isoform X1 [Schistocerca serialis cubense]